MADASAPAKQESTPEPMRVNVPDSRPGILKTSSNPSSPSPLRHHQRVPTPRVHHKVKTTLNAKSEYSNSDDDGSAQHRINQYLVKQEIGRGSFGAVHLAVDQFDNEYAVKEFSKSRLRKRAQSNLLRGPNARKRVGHPHAGRGLNSPLHRHSSDDQNNAFDLIKEEIAIMKKLNHPNVVALIEVLDDPTEDSLYMVMEMCKKGVVMKVGLEETADPYDEEQCRIWFRDLILGIEYLHTQGVVHRDIKPDNCLVTNDDILKVVDFGVSEMFEKESEMATSKSAGSPAFMPPELCIAKHGLVSGKACDIWSMGVTLYCLRHGKIPFEQQNIIDLYDSISNDPVTFAPDCSEELKDLLIKLLEKSPEKRIRMEEIREHPWVTQGGADPLPTKEENCAELLEPPTEAEVNAAITGNMRHLMVVVKAVKRFKQLLIRKRPDLLEGIFGRASRIVQPPLSMSRPSTFNKSSSSDVEEGKRSESELVSEEPTRGASAEDEVHRLSSEVDAMVISQTPTSQATQMQTQAPTQADGQQPKWADESHSRASSHPRSMSRNGTGKGQAHDPLLDQLYLNIGTGLEDQPAGVEEMHAVSESPGAVDINVYEKAYQEEVQRILAAKKSPTLYLTRRIEGSRELRNSEYLVSGGAKPGLARLVAAAREQQQQQQQQQQQAHPPLGEQQDGGGGGGDPRLGHLAGDT